MILKFLIGKSSVREKAILDHMREEPVRVRRILAALKKEGFIRKNRAGYRLAD
jgi:DNA-binding IclR family transcriptional regulator